MDGGHESIGFGAEDGEGWYEGRCVCGWSSGSVPDVETAADALMVHAYVKGFDSAR